MRRYLVACVDEDGRTVHSYVLRSRSREDAQRAAAKVSARHAVFLREIQSARPGPCHADARNFSAEAEPACALMRKAGEEARYVAI
jgi:hypothetical protein